jgi:ABC-type transport system substrate-binding protein
MKSRSFLVVLAMLLVVPAIVNAEEAAEPAPADQAQINDVEQVADEPLTCEPQASTETFDPEAYTDTCGQCSTYSFCRGVPRGTPCGYGKWCIPTNTMFCPGTQDWNCQCARHYN